VLPILKSNNTSLCLVADDPDLAVVLIAEYILTINSALTQEKVLQILKERRP
jgi:NADPH-dependent 7-cyano-7-deazaguanine reductase QueF